MSAVHSGIKPVPLVTTLLVVICLVICWRMLSPREVTAGWHHSVDEGMAEAQLAQKPLLVLFTADWCPPCRKLKSETLRHPEVAAFLEANCVLVKVDLTERGGPNSAVAGQFGVQSIPQLFLVTPNGYELDHRGGYMPPFELMEWIRQNQSIR